MANLIILHNSVNMFETFESSFITLVIMDFSSF